jgi:hypothetical protein
MDEEFRYSIPPDWSKIEDASEAAIEFLEAYDLSTDAVATINMVFCELIENALKYGRFDTDSDKVSMSVDTGAKTVTVTVTNPVQEHSLKHLKRLDQTVQWIRGHHDPFEAYVERLREISKRPLTDEESGLGLARIAYEGQAIIDFIVDNDDVLTVSAVVALDDLQGSSS